MANTLKKTLNALRRANRTRARLHGTAERPRMSVKRSARHIYVQVINDDAGTTLASASDANVSTDAKPVDIAREVGKLVAKKATEAGITSVVFDRGSYRYHGRIAALAQGAREGGLKF